MPRRKPIYNRLVEFEPGSTKVVPGLAESWEVSADGLEYTFHLRKGVKFHTTDYFTPTRDFDADDVVFTFERQMNKDNPYFDYAGGDWPYFAAMSMPELIKSVEQVDDATVKFTLTRAEAPFLADLAMDFASILSKEYADKLAAAGKTRDCSTEQPIGTGPFQFVGYDKDAIVRFKANPDYWGGKPEIDELDLPGHARSGARRTEAAGRRVPGHADPAPGRHRGAAGPTRTSRSIQQESARHRLPRLQHAGEAVRRRAGAQGAQHGDRQAGDRRRRLAGAAGTVANGPMPPTMWSLRRDVDRTIPTIPTAAKEAARRSRRERTSKMKLWAMPVARPYNPDPQRTAEMIKADFAKIGVEASIVSYRFGRVSQVAPAPRIATVPCSSAGRATTATRTTSSARLLGCDAVGANNRAEWCYQPFDDLIRKAKVTTDPAERARLYGRRRRSSRSRRRGRPSPIRSTRWR